MSEFRGERKTTINVADGISVVISSRIHPKSDKHFMAQGRLCVDRYAVKSEVLLTSWTSTIPPQGDELERQDIVYARSGIEKQAYDQFREILLSIASQMEIANPAFHLDDPAAWSPCPGKVTHETTVAPAAAE
jgi:hypothetical protein